MIWCLVIKLIDHFHNVYKKTTQLCKESFFMSYFLALSSQKPLLFFKRLLELKKQTRKNKVAF